MAASSVGCDKGEVQLTCLQTVSMERLLKTSIGSGPNGAQAVIDGSFTTTPFLPMSPKEIISSDKYNANVSLLLGSNEDEGLLHTATAYQNPAIIEQWRSKWIDTFGPSTLLGLRDQPIDKNAREITKKITEHYVGSVDGLTFDNIKYITNMYTDSWFSHPIHDFVSRLVSKKRKISTFQYRLTHQGQLSISMFMGLGGPYGVNHADELAYIFTPFSNHTINLNDKDKQMSEIILPLWKSFVKTGKPSTATITWDPILVASSRKYLNLNLNPVMEYPDEIKTRMEFWDKIVAEIDYQKDQKSQNKSNCERNFLQHTLFMLVITYLFSI